MGVYVFPGGAEEKSVLWLEKKGERCMGPTFLTAPKIDPEAGEQVHQLGLKHGLTEGCRRRETLCCAPLINFF